MTLDELAHEIAIWTIQGRNKTHTREEWARQTSVHLAYKRRMEVEDYLAHQFGHKWDDAHIHKTYSDHGDDTPTGGIDCSEPRFWG